MKNILTHKGYIGSVNYSAEDECLYGKIEFINDLIMYDGDSVASIQAAFVDAVDSYIEFCAEEGKEPNQPFKGSFNVRLGETMHRQAAMEARKLGLNLNEFVKEAIASKLTPSPLVLQHVHHVTIDHKASHIQFEADDESLYIQPNIATEIRIQ